MIMVTIDPGINGTGYAIWGNKELKKYGVIIPPKQFKSLKDKAGYIITQLDIAMCKYLSKFNKVYVEEPAFFQSAGGRVTAGSGSLIKLTLLVGMIINKFDAMSVKVNDWKGQLPKEVVIQRIKNTLKEQVKDVKTHAWDAIGMGLYLKG